MKKFALWIAIVLMMCGSAFLLGAHPQAAAEAQEHVRGEAGPKKGESSQVFASAQVNVILVCGHEPGEEMYLAYSERALDMEFVYRTDGGPCR
jgi:hypothetical protein